MIRIDEIYCNTFVPLIQAKKNSGLHWFDPFGSTEFGDLCNVPPIANVNTAQRYLFWDQEPLYKDRVDVTLTQFTAMFSQGTRHIVTSEYASENVEYIKDTYGFVPHYYWFHGWAALDWFRGYNYSHLITPPEKRTIISTLVAPNRIIGGKRSHRLIFMYFALKQGFSHAHISFPAVCPAELITVAQAVEPLVTLLPDIKTVFAAADLPYQFAGETDHPMSSYRLDLFEQCADSLLYVVTETQASGRRQHLTEKTFKPICLQMPFILISSAGSLEYLRRYGFRTFSDFWDESYDTITDDVVRIERAVDIMKQIDGLSQREKQKLHESLRSTVQHNYDHFYRGAFADTLWLELQHMMRGMGV